MREAPTLMPTAEPEVAAPLVIAPVDMLILPLLLSMEIFFAAMVPVDAFEIAPPFVSKAT